MKTIKKFTAIQMNPNRVNDEITISLSFGNIEGPYYDQDFPLQEFDSEEEAIKYASERDKYLMWMIVPIVRFTND